MRFVDGPLAAALCVSLVTSSTPGWADRAPGHSAVRPPYHGQIQGDERILHALNRFTFGPRPGDLEAVHAMGLDKWFERQLHPASIDQTALQARLAQYPAMQWSSEDLLYRMPSNAVIRQVIDGKAPMPEHGILHSIYEDQAERVAAKRKDQEQKKQLAAASTAATPAMAANEAGVRNAPESRAAEIQSGQMHPSPMQPNTMAATAAPAEPVVDPALISKVLALPPRDRVTRLAAMPEPELDALLHSLKGPERKALTDDMPPELKETVGALENPDRTVVEELMAQRLIRDTYSEAQLQEVMTDFWLNHFNVYLRKDEATPYYLVSYERDVIRPHSLGKFEDLLEATAHSPAMLLYLDNWTSTGPDSPASEKAAIHQALNPNPAKKKNPRQGINENYARELMELHTLGVNGGYKQADVIQAARILTGWTVEKPQRGGGFKFDETRHEPGTKVVMGKKFKEHGEKEGRELLHYLATRPATAQFLSRKLAIRFVSDEPPQDLVNRMAHTYLSSGGDIAAVLRTMFRAPEFWSGGVYRAKIKTPLEYVVSAARASNADIANPQPLVNALREMGMPLYGCIPPTGYKWDAADWVSTGALVNRMNFALTLASNHYSGVVTGWISPQSAAASPPAAAASAPAQPGVTPETEEARLESLLLAGGVSQSTHNAVLQQFAQQTAQAIPGNAAAMPAGNPQPHRNPAPPSPEKQDQLLAGLLLGSPEFQRR